MQNIPSYHDFKIIQKLNGLLIFVQKNKRQPNESKQEIVLARQYGNLMRKETLRSNKFYTDLINQIESLVERQHRSITKDFAIDECKKYKSLTELNEKDRSLYKQIICKPWFKEIKEQSFSKS